MSYSPLTYELMLAASHLGFQTGIAFRLSQLLLQLMLDMFLAVLPTAALWFRRFDFLTRHVCIYLQLCCRIDVGSVFRGFLETNQIPWFHICCFILARSMFVIMK